ncbi:MAG: ATP-binding protein [bacterium]|nr:ATP-binding protein [bacterium]
MTTPQQTKDLDKLDLMPEQESVWIEVIHQIDQAYAELVKTQVELEESNLELRKANDFLDNIQRDMSDLLIVTSAEGRVIKVNQFFERIAHLDPKSLLGQSLEACFAPQEQKKLRQLMTNGRIPCQDLEMDLLVDQELLRLSVNSSPRFDNDGAYAGLVLIGRPIGELQRAYKELEQAHQELMQTQEQLIHAEKMASLGRLVAGVAHEMNNPFSFLFSNLFILQDYLGQIGQYIGRLEQEQSPAQLDAARKDLHIVKILADINPLVEGSMEGAVRLQDIIAGLKQFSSTQTRQSIEFDLCKAVRTALGWIKGKVAPQVIDQMPESLLVQAPAGEISQVIVNLLQNAMDAMAENPTPQLELTAGTKGNRAWVCFKDWGSGITPQNLDKIWEPFFTTKPIGEGTGLGLSVSFGIIEKLGGTLKAANHAEGAQFTFTLPLKPRHE